MVPEIVELSWKRDWQWNYQVLGVEQVYYT